MNLEDANSLLLQFLQNLDHGNYGAYGYEVYLPTLLRRHFNNQGVTDHGQLHGLTRDHYPSMTAAAWEFCRRGVLRPGVKEFGGQATDDGQGAGFTITPFGRQWLDQTDLDDHVPIGTERFSQMLGVFTDRYGPAFRQRSQEAIDCYGAHTYLACCTMAGAAAESILLAVAMGKVGEEQVAREYRGAAGRLRVESMVIGQQGQGIKTKFQCGTDLLKYWRDASAHGEVAQITENEAFTALSALLRFAQFVSDEWEGLTQP